MKTINPTFTFVRHGNTAKAANDLDRQLTDTGREQARRLGEILADQHFDIAFVSVADRALETAAGVIGNRPVPVVAIEELYLPTGEDGKLMDDMFAQLGYAPLSAYRAHKDAAVLTRFAAAFKERMDQELELKFGNDLPENLSVLIVGHAVMLNAIAADRGSSTESDEGVEMALKVALGECEALRITAQVKKVIEAEHITLN